VRCDQLRHLDATGICAGCTRAAAPRKTPKTIICSCCGQQRRNVGRGLCNRCNLADPDRPFRYATAQAARMVVVPSWWGELTAFTAARHHPSGTVIILRETCRLLADEPTAVPQRLLARCANDGPTSQALTAFFTDRGLALPDDYRQQYAARRRARYLETVPAPLSSGVAAFHSALLDERERARRRGKRPLADATMETKLRILRDLAVHLIASRPVTGWAEVTTADLECWIAHTPARRHQLTYVLRRFFTWAKGRKLVLVDPARSLRLGPQPAFAGTIIDHRTQLALFGRWTSAETRPYERLIGLLALLHAASSTQIRSLVITDIDSERRTLDLAGRPFPTAIDPATWTALEACLAQRDALGTLNPHVVVTGATRTGDRAAHPSYLSRLLRPAQTTPSVCRQTRLARLVIDLDPKLTASALGMNGGGLVRYMDDNITHDRLESATRHR